MGCLRATATIATSLIAAVGTLDGCGGDGSTRRLRASGPISGAEATAFAHTVNLSVADMPEWTSVSLEADMESEPHGPFARCLSGHGTVLAAIHSPTFRSVRGKEVQNVNSQVEVVPSAALAARNFAAAASTRGRACLGRLLPLIAQGLESKREVRRPAASFLTVALPHVRTLGTRLAFQETVTLGGVSKRMAVNFDTLETLAGPATIGLTAIGAPNPVSAGTERRLLTLLYGRAMAHER